MDKPQFFADKLAEGVATIAAAFYPKDVIVRPFMRMKLEASNKVLEGLTTEDFRLVREGASTLHKMSSAEKWRVSNDVLYRQYSAEFNREAERLLERANERNLDGATLAWMECTMSCVRCHKYARAIKIAGH